MIIKQIKIKTGKKYITLQAVCKIRKIGTDIIYFKVDKKYKDFISKDASAFAACLLVPCMKLNEDLIIHGSISKKMYEGMQEIMKIMSSWDLDLHVINIKADRLIEDTQKSKNIGLFFSAGVDSFYSYLKNKNSNDEKVTHFIIVNGFDIDLRNKQLWDLVSSHIHEIAKIENIEVIEIESNIHNLIEPIMKWDYTHGGCLAAVALALRNNLKRVFIASSLTADDQIPWGSNLFTDKLWSTEKLEFVHDGVEATRTEKIKNQISLSPLALEHLRVCYMNEKGKYNCGKCEKCIRTLINFKLANINYDIKSFPNSIDIEDLKRFKISSFSGYRSQNENLMFLKKYNIDKEIQDILQEKISDWEKTYKPSKNKSIFTKIIYLDHMYNKGLIFKTISEIRGRFLFS